MAKGAKKKTKWVSLSLASAATSTTAPTAGHEAAYKSSRGTNKSVNGDDSAVNSNKSSNSENALSNVPSVDRKSSWNTNGYSRRHSAEGSGGQTYSNGYQNYPSRHYSAHFKSHYSRSSYYHNGSRRTHNDRNRFNNVNETKSEQNGAVIINEEEYTKITTPRQDVLFKKGYLSRPKKYTATSSTNANENGTATGSSSVNGGTTDGSDVATGSGTVSTTESVMSDSTYLTDGHLLDYPAPLPYFGYIDQSGVLVMNGFAVDNSGFPYMNGGQTYIYPPNYHCQSSFNEDGQVENGDETEPVMSDGDQNQSADSFESVSEAETTVNGLDSVDTGTTRLHSISEEIAEGLVNEGDGVDLNQQVPQQPMLSPFENSYDYAQFYNAFYYPGCMVAPFPVLTDEMYCDQFGEVNDEEQARQQSFRKRKKRYRNWDEYPPAYYPDGTIDTMYQYPNVLCIPENETSDPNEVPIDGIIPEPNLCDRAVPTLPPITENIEYNQKPNELPSSHRVEQSTSPSHSSKSPNTQKAEDRSPPSTVPPQASGKPKSHIQKTRKKDLIEMTRAFAEQTIDLTRPVSLYKSTEVQKSETNEWRTVRNGKEITIQDDRERVSATNKSPFKKSNGEAEPAKTEKLFFDDCKPVQTMVTEAADDNKRGKKDTTAKKGKKTAKGKGKKQKKQGFLQQQTGFEVIEPEFIPEASIEKDDNSDITNVDEEVTTIDYENSAEVDAEEKSTNKVEHDEVQNHISNEAESVSQTLIIENGVDDDEESLENDLRDIQLSDLQIEICDQENRGCLQEEVVIDSDSQKSENVEISEELIVQNMTSCILEKAIVHENDELLEVPSDTIEAREELNLETTSDETCAEEKDLIEKQLTVDCNLPLNPAEFTSIDHMEGYEIDMDGEEQKCQHFSNEDYFEDFDSGVQSPAAFTTSSTDSKERKSSSSSIGSQDIHLTDAVTKWLSETLSNKRLEEMFVLPEDPLLLHRIHQFNFLNFDDSLVLSSDTYSSSSGDEADECVDSDYMSDVQAKNRELNGGSESLEKTELKKDQLAKQTANGHCLLDGGDHSNHKQKRCIIM